MRSPPDEEGDQAHYQEGDQAQKHVVDYHTGGHAHNHMELAIGATAWMGIRTTVWSRGQGHSQDRGRVLRRPTHCSGGAQEE